MNVDGQRGVVSVSGLVSKAEYARQRNWDRSYLSKKDVAKRLAPAMTMDAKGRRVVNVALANAIFKRETDTAKVRKNSQLPLSDDETEFDPLINTDSLDAHRREGMKLKNEAMRLEMAREKGQTVLRTGVVGATAWAGQKLREHLHNRNKHLADKLATMTDVREIKTMLDADDRKMLETVSNDFMRRIRAITAGGGQPTTH